MNNWLDMYVIVARMVSSTKELLQFPHQLPPVAIHQTISTHLHIFITKDIIYLKFSLNVAWYMSEVQ